jgi:glycosyltransferase involved in cell wall biosynthesis
MIYKIKILTLTGYYLPGYKAGGPLRTVANMVDRLSDEFEFWIITRDRDLFETSPYKDIKPNEWQQVGKAMVYYLSPGKSTIHEMAELISETPHDILYLNSFFDPVTTIKPLVARRLAKLPCKPLVLAPRGEFSAGALQFRCFKKFVYLKVARLLSLYDNVTWQASSVYEALDITMTMRVNPADIHVAIDLSAPVATDMLDSISSPDCISDSQILRVVFLSRISPMKNLDYALRVLQQVTVQVTFDIYGPAEDAVYWQFCQNMIKQLPENITASYKGSVPANHVNKVFSMYDLFLFPTRGENYGHVIAESLSTGTPVLLSDQTPWRNLLDDHLGWDLPLEDLNGFVDKIIACSRMTSEERQTWRSQITEKITDRLTDPAIIQANRELFRQTTKEVRAQ